MILDKATNRTEEESKKEKEDIARRKLEIKKRERFHKARKAIANGITILAEATGAGDAEAAENLAKAAIQVSGLLIIAEKRHPELMKSIAQGQIMWPVMATDEPRWVKDAARHVAGLNLGKGSEKFKTRFRQARGADINLPSRLWAKAAVRTIEETRFRRWSFGAFANKFGNARSLIDFAVTQGLSLDRDQPAWVKDAMSLNPFCEKNLPSWKLAIRKLIREEMPNFHEHSDWKTQRNSAEQRGRDTKGEIQNAILDDICSALKRIVPTT